MAFSSSQLSREMILLHGPRIRRWILSVVVAGVPLLFFRFTNDPFNVPKLALLATGIGLVVSVRIVELLQGSPWASLKRLLLPAGAVGIPLLIAWAFSPYRYWALFGAYGRYQGLLPYLLVLLLGILVADAFADDLRHLAWAITIAGGVAGAYAVLQFIGIDPFDWAQQAGGATTRTSTLGNPNFTGGFLAMALPVALGLWRSGDPYSQRALQATLAIAAGLLVSFSQGGYAAAAAGGLVFAGFYFSDRFKLGRALALTAVVGISGAVIGAVGFAMLNPSSDIIPATTAQRALWWRGAVSMVQEHPVIGRGPNTYAVEGNRFRPPDDATTHGLDYSDDTHSVPLAFATGAGALGFFGFLALAAWTISRARSIRSEDLVQVGLVAAAAAYFVQSLVSIDEIALRTTFWALLGGIAASFFVSPPTKGAAKTTRSPQRKPRSKRRTTTPLRFLPLVGLVAIAGLLSLWWSTRFVLNDARISWGVEAFRAGKPDRGQSEFERSLDFRGDYHYRHLYGFYAGEVATARQDDGADWIEEAQAAYSFLDGTPLVPALVDYASLLAEYEEFDESLRPQATAAHERLIALDPYNVAILPRSVEVLSAFDRHQEVIASLEDKIEVVGGPAPSLWAYLSLAYTETGSREKAADALEKAEAGAVTEPILQEARKALAAD